MPGEVAAIGVAIDVASLLLPLAEHVGEDVYKGLVATTQHLVDLRENKRPFLATLRDKRKQASKLVHGDGSPYSGWEMASAVNSDMLDWCADAGIDVHKSLIFGINNLIHQPVVEETLAKAGNAAARSLLEKLADLLKGLSKR